MVKDNPRIVAQFLKYHPPVELPLCKNDLSLLLSPEKGVFNPTPSASQLNVIKHACGRADVREIFEGELAEEEKNLEKSRAELGREKAAKRREPCIDRLMTDGGKALVAATLKMRLKSTETANWSRLLDQIYGLNSNPPRQKILPLVTDYCAEEENADGSSVDDSRVRQIKKLIEALST